MNIFALMNDVFCDTLRARFESALSKVHFLCSSEEMSNYKALNDNFLHGPNQDGLELNDDFLHNPGVLEYAIINDNVDLLKYASDLGLVKADISEYVFEKACEEGSKEVLEYFISVFQTIDYTGIFTCRFMLIAWLQNCFQASTRTHQKISS